MEDAIQAIEKADEMMLAASLRAENAAKLTISIRATRIPSCGHIVVACGSNCINHAMHSNMGLTLNAVQQTAMKNFNRDLSEEENG